MQLPIKNFWHSLSFNFSDEVEKSFSNFIELVSTTINTHAPLIKASRKLTNKPWITKGILGLIRQKKLYINFFKNCIEIEKILHKIYANKLSKVITLLKNFIENKRLSTLVMICVNFGVL